MRILARMIYEAHRSAILLCRGSSLAVALLATSALAQTTAGNDVMLNAGVDRYTWRGEINDNDKGGEVHQGFEKLSWRGLGDNGSKCWITAFTARNFQDQERSSGEVYNWIIRSGSDSGGPDLSPAGEMFRSGLMQLGPAMGSGAIAYEVTTILRTPVEIHCDDFFTVGCVLPANTSWPRDGQSVWISADLNGIDDNEANDKATNSAWQRIGDANRATNPRGNLVWHIGFRSAEPILQVANVVSRAPHRRFGKGGLFPEIGQGLSARVRANGKAGQLSVVILAAGFSSIGIPLYQGPRIWVDFATYSGPIVGALLAKQNGIDVADLVLAPAIPIGVTGDFVWQAMILDTATLNITLSNAVRSRL